MFFHEWVYTFLPSRSHVPKSLAGCRGDPTDNPHGVRSSMPCCVVLLYRGIVVGVKNNHYDAHGDGFGMELFSVPLVYFSGSMVTMRDMNRIATCTVPVLAWTTPFSGLKKQHRRHTSPSWTMASSVTKLLKGENKALVPFRFNLTGK